MGQIELNAELVDKEEVAGYHFPSEDVLVDAQEILKRKMDIERATSLGNTEKFKIKIYFEDDKGPKQVETTIWAAGPEHIVLKKGVFIPVHRVYAIRFL